MGQPTLQPGDTLEGKYVIKRLLGEGGMGKVYEAVHIQIDKTVAVKRLNPEHAGNATNVERFLREAKAAAAIGHHGIIDIYDIGISDDGAPFLVMEHLVGHTLSYLIEKLKRLDEPTTAYIGCQSLSALVAAHNSGIVHRDLKPDNIFLVDVSRPLPEVKILDFGISKIMATSAQSQSLTVTGAVLGTPFYMSPEQASGDKTLDNRVDIWAVGIILYECLTGRVPYLGETYNEVLAKILMNDVDRPTSLVSDISHELEQVVMKALARKREERYGSATEILVDLMPFVDERHSINISISQELRDSMSAISQSRESNPPTLLGDSSEQAQQVASSPSQLISIDTEFTTGETLAAQSAGTTGEGQLSAASELPKIQRSLWPLIVVVAILLFASGALAVVLFVPTDLGQGNAPPPPDVQHQDRSTPTGQLAAPIVPEDNSIESATVEISIRVQPEDATITVDGTKLDDNPFVGQFMIDRNQHSIRAEARGYETKTWTIAFTEDREISTKLAQKRSTKTKGSVKPPRRGVDDPWAGESKLPGPAKEDPWGN